MTCESRIARAHRAMTRATNRAALSQGRVSKAEQGRLWAEERRLRAEWRRLGEDEPARLEHALAAYGYAPREEPQP